MHRGPLCLHRQPRTSRVEGAAVPRAWLVPQTPGRRSCTPGGWRTGSRRCARSSQRRPSPLPRGLCRGTRRGFDWPLADGNLVRAEEESHVRGEGEALPHRLLCTLIVVADTAQGKHCEGLPVAFPLQPSHKWLREDLREKGGGSGRTPRTCPRTHRARRWAAAPRSRFVTSPSPCSRAGGLAPKLA